MFTKEELIWLSRRMTSNCYGESGDSLIFGTTTFPYQLTYLTKEYARKFIDTWYLLGK